MGYVLLWPYVLLQAFHCLWTREIMKGNCSHELRSKIEDNEKSTISPDSLFMLALPFWHVNGVTGDEISKIQ